MNTIASMWASYEADVIPAAAGQNQRRRVPHRLLRWRAHALLQLLKALGEPEVSEDAGAAVLEGLERESYAFCDDVVAGRV